MENYLELLKHLLKRYEEKEDMIRVIKHELGLVKDWIQEHEPESSIENHRLREKEISMDGAGDSERSVFEDIDA
jgi:hypothetical protein